jgi:hypothetical protein
MRTVTLGIASRDTFSDRILEAFRGKRQGSIISFERRTFCSKLFPAVGGIFLKP